MMTDIERRKVKYRKGLRVRLNKFAVDDVTHDDNLNVPPGVFGTVDSVDDGGTVHTHWDNGRNLGFLPEDDVSIVHDPYYAPLIDADGREIKAGDWVSIYGSTEDVGYITHVTDPDGDTDDEGKIRGINPAVYVKFDDDEDKFPTTWTARWYSDTEAPYRCDDLETCGDRNPNNDPGA